jgi:hypothetical protein
MSSPDVGGLSTTLDFTGSLSEAWETWGIAARWNPQHLWHAPDEAP